MVASTFHFCFWVSQRRLLGYRIRCFATDGPLLNHRHLFSVLLACLSPDKNTTHPTSLGSKPSDFRDSHVEVCCAQIK